MRLRNMRLLLIFIFVLHYSSKTKSVGNEIFHVALKEDNSVTLDWIVNYITEQLQFEVHVPSNFGWYAIGFSDRGELFPADFCILWYDWEKKLHFQVSVKDLRNVLILNCTRM